MTVRPTDGKYPQDEYREAEDNLDSRCHQYPFLSDIPGRNRLYDAGEGLVAPRFSAAASRRAWACWAFWRAVRSPSDSSRLGTLGMIILRDVSLVRLVIRVSRLQSALMTALA